MSNSVPRLAPFEFQSDFSAPTAPPVEGPDTVRMSAEELADLLANARAEGVETAVNHHEAAKAAHLEAAAKQLQAALDDLVKLANCLDAASLDADRARIANRLMTAACQHIIDGQADLFADQ